MRGAWIEIAEGEVENPLLLSLPMRGAWIEIYNGKDIVALVYVAPHAGSVD